LNALSTLEKKGKLTINVNAHIVCAPVNFAMETQESLIDLLDRAPDFDSEHVNARRVKFWLDGAPLPPQYIPFLRHELIQSYTHATILKSGEIDLSKILIPWDEFLGYLERWDSKCYSCKIHVAGDGSAKYALDAIEELRKKHPNGPRHELAHCNDVQPTDVKRFAPLRVTAELSPCIWHRTEPELTVKELVFPFKSFYESGATVSIGTDWFLPETPNLFAGISGIISRPRENLPLKTVLRIVTKEAAAAAGVENTGVIENGKRANFIILDRNILTAEEIKSTRVRNTYFEGKMVYDYDTDEDRDAFDIYT
jgi:predicted amidohydrolase YtcJ